MSVRAKAFAARSPYRRRRAGHLAAFESLTPAQQTAIMKLHFAVPTHGTLLKLWGVRRQTLQSLARAKLSRHIRLMEEGCSAAMPFWTLTQRGEELRLAAIDAGKLP